MVIFPECIPSSASNSDTESNSNCMPPDLMAVLNMPFCVSSTRMGPNVTYASPVSSGSRGTTLARIIAPMSRALTLYVFPCAGMRLSLAKKQRLHSHLLAMARELLCAFTAMTLNTHEEYGWLPDTLTCTWNDALPEME